MPRSTQSYPFEWKILGYAGAISDAITGRKPENPSFAQSADSFVMTLSTDGAVRAIHFGTAEEPLQTLMEQLQRSGESFLFYDPFDAPVYTFLSWQNIERATFEHLLGEAFTDSDFTGRAEPKDTFPVTWGVMF